MSVALSFSYLRALSVHTGLEDELTFQESGVPQEEGRQRTGKAAKANEVRVTTPYMTKYERARVLGTRALQIRSVGHP